MVRAAKLEVYCVVEVEGQQRRTVPIAGGSGVSSDLLLFFVPNRRPTTFGQSLWPTDFAALVCAGLRVTCSRTVQDSMTMRSTTSNMSHLLSHLVSCRGS